MGTHKIKLSEKEELRIQVRQLKGRSFADVRVYAHARTEEEKWPTGKGFLVPVSLLPEIRQAFSELNAAADL